MATPPRQFQPHEVYHVSRRTTGGMNLLLQTPEAREIVTAAVQELRVKHDVDVLLFSFMSDHYHSMLAAADSNSIPAFYTELHARIARELGVPPEVAETIESQLGLQLAGSIGFWERGKRTFVKHVDSYDYFVEVASYILCNPYAAGIGNTVDAYSGASCKLSELGESHRRQFGDHTLEIPLSLPSFGGTKPSGRAIRADVGECLRRRVSAIDAADKFAKRRRTSMPDVLRCRRGLSSARPEPSGANHSKSRWSNDDDSRHREVSRRLFQHLHRAARTQTPGSSKLVNYPFGTITSRIHRPIRIQTRAQWNDALSDALADAATSRAQAA